MIHIGKDILKDLEMRAKIHEEKIAGGVIVFMWVLAFLGWAILIWEHI